MYGIDDDLDIVQTQYTIEELRQDLDNVVRYFQSMPYHDHAMKLFMEDYRGFPREVIDACDCFCVDEELNVSDLPEWMTSPSLGVVSKGYLTMAGRCVFPLKDVYNNTMGFVGWDPTTTPKYLDSKNYGYKAKTTTFYGMEKLYEYYNSNKPVFLTEGLMCCLYLRWKGYQALASLGSWLSSYQIQILKRFKDRLCAIPDNDETGDRYCRQIKTRLPLARVYQVRYGKDVDGCRKEDDHRYEEELLKDLQSCSNPFYKTNILIRR